MYYNSDSTHFLVCTRLVLLLRELGLVTVAEMTGAISSSKRREVLEDFRRGRTKVGHPHTLHHPLIPHTTPTHPTHHTHLGAGVH